MVHASSSATRTASSTPWAASPRPRWKRRAPRSPRCSAPSRARSCSPPAPPRATTSPSRARPASRRRRWTRPARRSSPSPPSTNASWNWSADLARRRVRAGVPAGPPGRAARSRRAARGARHADPAGQHHGGQQRDRGDPGPAGARRDRAREAGALFHTDAAQAVGQDPARRRRLAHRPDARSAATSSTGRKGVGGLYVRRRPRVRLAPLFSGGGQERGLRSGTLPAPLIVGLGEACRLARGRDGRGGAPGRARCATGCWSGCATAVPEIALNGSMERRLPGNLNLTFPRRLRRRDHGRGAGGRASRPARPAPRPWSSRPMSCARWGSRTRAAARSLRIGDRTLHLRPPRSTTRRRRSLPPTRRPPRTRPDPDLPAPCRK